MTNLQTYPLPPEELRRRVTNNPDAETYVKSGGDR
jgi:hypothetical protein